MSSRALIRAPWSSYFFLNAVLVCTLPPTTMPSAGEGRPASERSSTRGDPHGSASRTPDEAAALFDERSEEFAAAPAARAAESMRVACAQKPPWDAPPPRGMRDEVLVKPVLRALPALPASPGSPSRLIFRVSSIPEVPVSYSLAFFRASLLSAARPSRSQRPSSSFGVSRIFGTSVEGGLRHQVREALLADADRGRSARGGRRGSPAPSSSRSRGSTFTRPRPHVASRASSVCAPAVLRDDVVAGGVDVAGVEAEREPGPAVGAGEDRGEVGEVVPEAGTLAGRRLEENRRPRRRRLRRRLVEAPSDPVEARLLAVAPVRAGVEDEERDAVRVAPPDLVDERLDGPGADDGVGRREVDEVGRVRDEGSETRIGRGAPERGRLGRDDRLAGPLVRVLREDLERSAARRRRPSRPRGRARPPRSCGRRRGARRPRRRAPHPSLERERPFFLKRLFRFLESATCLA